jgi:cyanate permease
MTAWKNAALILLAWGAVQFVLLLLWWRVSHRQRDEVEQDDDVSGLHVFDDDDFF